MPVVSQSISTPEIASAVRLPEPGKTETLFTRPLPKEPFAAALYARLYPTTRSDDQAAQAILNSSLLTEGLKDSFYGESAGSLAGTKAQSVLPFAVSRDAHFFAVQSLVKEYHRNFTTEPEESELIVNKHIRKQKELLKKAVDEIHADFCPDFRAALPTTGG
jgi:hypothetical protein